MESELAMRLKMLIDDISKRKKGGILPTYYSTSYSGSGLYGSAISPITLVKNKHYKWFADVLKGNLHGEKITQKKMKELYGEFVKDENKTALFEDTYSKYPLDMVEENRQVIKDLLFPREKKEIIPELKKMTKEELINLLLDKQKKRKDKILSSLNKKKKRCIELLNVKKGNYSKKELEKLIRDNKDCAYTVASRKRREKNLKNPRDESDYIKFIKEYRNNKILEGRQSFLKDGSAVPFSYKDAMKEIKEQNLYKKGGILSLFL